MNTQILNKYIELINKGYCEDCNELNCIGNFPHKEIAKNIKDILEENQELKQNIKNLVHIINHNCLELETTDEDLKNENQQKEFIEYLENEKNRLAKECSYTYEGSLGKLLYVNENIFNEVNRILLKYKEIIGGDNK